jgi:hypothetical protein
VLCFPCCCQLQAAIDSAAPLPDHSAENQQLQEQLNSLNEQVRRAADNSRPSKSFADSHHHWQLLLLPLAGLSWSWWLCLPLCFTHTHTAFCSVHPKHSAGLVAACCFSVFHVCMSRVYDSCLTSCSAVIPPQLVALEGDKQQLMHERGGVVREQTRINGEANLQPSFIDALWAAAAVTSSCVLLAVCKFIAYVLCASQHASLPVACRLLRDGLVSRPPCTPLLH